MTDDPLLTSQRQPEDADAALRPKTRAEFVGQAAARAMQPRWAQSTLADQLLEPMMPL